MPYKENVLWGRTMAVLMLYLCCTVCKCVAKIVDESFMLELTFESSHLLWQWICVFYI